MTTVHTRWMIRRDFQEVLEIEASSFGTPWTEDDFLRCLKQRNCIGMVAETADRVLGFMVYELHKSRINIANFAVHPAFRRQSIGRQMIAKLEGKLSFNRRNAMTVTVNESNLDALLFFKRLGFLATDVLRGHFDEEDGIAMRFTLASRVIEPRELELV